jgi:phosphatidate cytidylyltransferase
MSNTKQRVIAASMMSLGALIIAVAQYFGFHAVRWAGVVIAVAMIVEFIMCLRRADNAVKKQNNLLFNGFLVWLFVMMASIYFIGNRPWIVLLLLLIICSADIGAWFFGRLLGGDKMWERLSAGKTWSGQIAGIICGTFASIMYGLIGTDVFMPQLMWIGISVSLLSQYGDLTASWIKRKLGVKDFGTILPGHGGVLDRFDGWIYVLPLVWLIML